MSHNRSHRNHSKHYPQQNWRQPAPSFGQPVIVGYMSVDGEREYRSDLSELKFVINRPQTPVQWDLNHNIDKAVKRTTEDNVEKIDLLLKFILDKGPYLDLREKFTIITYRRTLLQVMCKAWPASETCRIAAALFDGCIYLCSLQTSEQVVDRKSWSAREKMMCAWGYKFEQMMTSDLPNTAPDIEKPVIENAEFSLYYDNTFGSHRLIYGAQIDGCTATGNTPPPPPSADYRANIQYLRDQRYIELKTNKLITNKHSEINYKRRKLLYCWGQCMVAGLQGLLVGLRDDEGVVRDLQYFDTQQIPQYCRDQWTPVGPLTFLDYFLNHVKDYFREELRRMGCDDVTRVGPITAQFEIQTDRDRTITVGPCEPILPLWYVEGRRKQTCR